MDTNIESSAWINMTREEKQHHLFLKQKNLLDTFWEHGAISKEHHDKSLSDLAEKWERPPDFISVV